MFETFPPGQQATRIIPKAIEGLGFREKHKTKVRVGSASNCRNIPNKNGLGERFKKAKLDVLRLNATDNIMTPKAKAMPISEPRPNSKEKSSIELTALIMRYLV
jgi:hypothetical protein